jgi:hypothetical protein
MVVHMTTTTDHKAAATLRKAAELLASAGPTELASQVLDAASLYEPTPAPAATEDTSDTSHYAVFAHYLANRFC